MLRLWVILRHTFVEALVQPIYALLLVLASIVLGIYGVLPFFTLGEDVMMYKAVGLDLILIASLVAVLFTAGRTINEEVEDRTMLTLMSKPVGHWQVLFGKYLGLFAAAAIAVAVLGLVVAACVWYRVPGDYYLNPDTIDDRVLNRIDELRRMHLAGLWAQLVLLLMQVGVLLAIGVALSTRAPLVVSLPAVILLYLAGNLTRFMDVAAEGAGWFTSAVVWAITTVLPFLAVFDLRDQTVYAPIGLAGTRFADDVNAVSLGGIWGYVGVAAIYFATYVGFILAAGLFSFRTRELGGSAG